jgi:hypothetical protein
LIGVWFGVNLVHVGILCKKEILVKIFTKDWWSVLCEINLVKKVTVILGEQWWLVVILCGRRKIYSWWINKQGFSVTFFLLSLWLTYCWNL